MAAMRGACLLTSAPSTSYRPTSHLCLQRPKRRCLVTPRAENTPGTPPPAQDEEARLEALESSLKAKKGSPKAMAASQNRNASPSTTGGLAEWKEGQLFPEGWEDMDPLQKITELYLGKRGFLFWSTKLSLAGVIALAGAWVLFRFVGPAVGLYQLANDLSTPNF